MEFLENSIDVKGDLIYKIKDSITSLEVVSWKKTIIGRYINYLFRKDWDYKYIYPYNDEQKFFGKSKKSVNLSKVPIEQVLLHCLDKDDKVFTKISIDSSNIQTEFTIEGFGKFEIEKHDFENGIFDINFKSEKNFDGSIKLQFLTKSINLEKNLKEIDRIKKSIEDDKVSYSIEKKKSTQSKKSYEFEKI